METEFWLNLTTAWAHRTLIVRKLKGLDDFICMCLFVQAHNEE